MKRRLQRVGNLDWYSGHSFTEHRWINLVSSFVVTLDAEMEQERGCFLFLVAPMLLSSC